jgi:hypothetical protein
MTLVLVLSLHQGMTIALHPMASHLARKAGMKVVRRRMLEVHMCLFGAHWVFRQQLVALGSLSHRREQKVGSHLETNIGARLVVLVSTSD